ncbi:MAG: hypothetical protein HQK91_08330 [Nitrospirae bacterium]|nr:hypothetical protein [Nitrospirota bacterium]MBF0541439.1 hypothetical protein [Nitrospirota bacterium]
MLNHRNIKNLTNLTYEEKVQIVHNMQRIAKELKKSSYVKPNSIGLKKESEEILSDSKYMQRTK